MHRLSIVASTQITACHMQRQNRATHGQFGLFLMGGSQANVQLAVVSLTITL